MDNNQTKAGGEMKLRVLSRKANSLLAEKGNIFEVVQVQNLRFHSQLRALVAKVCPRGLDRGWQAQLQLEHHS